MVWSEKQKWCGGSVEEGVWGVVVEEGVKQKWCGGSCGGRRQTEVVCG